jgi:hypothetical protein
MVQMTQLTKHSEHADQPQSPIEMLDRQYFRVLNPVGNVDSILFAGWNGERLMVHLSEQGDLVDTKVLPPEVSNSSLEEIATYLSRELQLDVDLDQPISLDQVLGLEP